MRVQFDAAGTILISKLLSSFIRQDAALVWRKGWIVTTREHHVPVAQPAEATVSEAVRWRFESSQEHQILWFARVRKPAKRVGSNPTVWRFDFSHEHHAAVAQPAEADGLNPFQCRIVACLRHQPDARLAQRQSVPLTPGRSGFRDPQRVPMSASLAQRQSARPTCERRQDRPLQDAPAFAASQLRLGRPPVVKAAAPKRKQRGQHRQTGPSSSG